MTPTTPSAGRTSFDRVGEDEIGYEPAHVDAFMERASRTGSGEGSLTAEDVRQARFATVGGGYATDQVDDELDRMEEELVSAERAAWAESHGGRSWDEDLADRVRELRARADRAPAERFRRPSREEAESYDVGQVDALVDRIDATLAGDTDDAVSADDVRRAAFASAEGRDGYEEAQVDAYLDAVVDVLLRRA
ncbi:DivIVA domain-containing protein [Micrococcus sp.]|uniref:DivIVA domain-containing protein n=1 Tax=Micrococcus sp. TaxID=1271 RepID=UPI002A90C286|nr:DivIVA domain-containing protein [Micrococcus sp.]MDY6054691.1 DivIVA domain-containing protein [Micrococcus sp.]